MIMVCQKCDILVIEIILVSRFCIFERSDRKTLETSIEISIKSSLTPLTQTTILFFHSSLWNLIEMSLFVAFIGTVPFQTFIA